MRQQHNSFTNCFQDNTSKAQEISKSVLSTANQDVHAQDVQVHDVHIQDVQVQDVHVQDVQVQDVHVQDVQVQDVHAQDVHTETQISSSISLMHF